jgi:hypothetical protein
MNMEQPSFTEYQEYRQEGIAALFFITIDPDRSPQEFAREVAGFNDEVEDPWGWQVRGVRWAAVIENGPYHVVAAVRVASTQELDEYQGRIEEAGGTVNPSAWILPEIFKAGRGHNGGV